MNNQKLESLCLEGRKDYYTLDYDISGLEEYNNFVSKEVSKIILKRNLSILSLTNIDFI